jgi:hypothetical protein
MPSPCRGPASRRRVPSEPAVPVPAPRQVAWADPDLERELLQAMEDFERGDYIELTVEQLEHCAAMGESPRARRVAHLSTTFRRSVIELGLQPGSPAGAAAREWRPVVGADSLGPPKLPEHGFEDRLHRNGLRRLQRRAAQEHPAEGVGHGKRIAALVVPRF